MEKAFDFLKVLWDVVVNFVFEHKALVAGVMTIVGLMGFMNNLTIETQEQEQRAEIREKYRSRNSRKSI